MADGQDNSFLQSRIGRPHVIRSRPEQKSSYADYKDVLASDFLHSCGYCTLTEKEANAIGFEIDHYEPVTARRDLENEYTNLMWSCSRCNSFKGDVCPPAEARASGYFFYRPDTEVWTGHFEQSGFRLNARSTCGQFTIDNTELNRNDLQRMRRARAVIIETYEKLHVNLVAIKAIQLDQLPPQLRYKVSQVIREALEKGDELVGDLEKLILDHMKSPLLHVDNDSAVMRKRRQEVLKVLKQRFPGKWRGREYRSDVQ